MGSVNIFIFVSCPCEVQQRFLHHCRRTCQWEEFTWTIGQPPSRYQIGTYTDTGVKSYGSACQLDLVGKVPKMEQMKICPRTSCLNPVSLSCVLFTKLFVLNCKVGQVRNLTSKAGRALKKCEVQVFDNTASSFTLVLWVFSVFFSANGKKEFVCWKIKLKVQLLAEGCDFCSDGMKNSSV